MNLFIPFSYIGGLNYKTENAFILYSNLRPLGINLLKCAFSSTHLSYYNSKGRERQTREQERHTTTNRHSTPKTKNTRTTYTCIFNCIYQLTIY